MATRHMATATAATPASAARVTTIVASSTPAVKTRLTLHVPADAKVTLAGVETKQTGEVRQFATSKLASGQTWSDYKVVIETTHDGKVQREERSLTLTGGQNKIWQSTLRTTAANRLLSSSWLAGTSLSVVTCLNVNPSPSPGNMPGEGFFILIALVGNAGPLLVFDRLKN